MAEMVTQEEEQAAPNDGTDATEEHPDQIESPDEPVTYGERNKYLPDILKNCLKNALESSGRLEIWDRRREVMRDRRNRYYRRGFQHIYENKQTGMYALGEAGATVTIGNGQIECPQYIGDFNIFRPTELVIESVLTQNPPGIDFRPNTQSTEDLEAASTAEIYREFFDRANDTKAIQLKIVQMMCESGRTVVCVSTQANAQLLGFEDGEAKQRETAQVYGTLESKCIPLTARDQESLDALILYDDPSVNKAKGQYPHVRDKIKGGPAIGENMYERIARLGVLQGTRRGAQVSDALQHLSGRVNAFLRPSMWEGEFYDAPYELSGGDEEHDIPADRPEDNQNENGEMFTLRDKLNAIFPQGCHCVYVGQTYCESWAESLDDACCVDFPYEGDGMSREAMMDDAIIIQDFFNDLMNSLREAQDYGWPRTFIDAEEEEFDAIQNQRSEPYAYAMKKGRAQQALSASFFREPDLNLPDSLVKLMEYLGGPFLQFVMGTPPALFGAGDSDQKTAAGYGMARAQAMGTKGIPWMTVQNLMARMYTMAALKASRNPDYAEQILVPTKQGDKAMELSRLTKGHFGAYPDQDSSFPESTAAKRQLLQTLLTVASQNPQISAQILGDVYNWEIIAQVFSFKELQMMESEAGKKQMREIEELLLGSPIPPTPEQVAAFQQQQQLAQQQHAAAVLAAQQAGQLAPPAPPPPRMVALSAGDPTATPPVPAQEFPEELLKPSIEIDDLDFHQWEGPAGQQWLSTTACWRELNIGRPGADGDPMPNVAGVENVRLHVKQHLARMSAMMPAGAPIPPGKVAPDAAANGAATPPQLPAPASAGATM